MSPEFADQIRKAQGHLEVARKMLELGYYEQAGRTAYLAGFNAAQGYVFDLTGKTVKTHNGLHDRFYQLAKNDARFDRELIAFLSRSFRLKAIADYEVGPSAKVPPDMAKAAVATAEYFVAVINELISQKQP